MGYFKRLDPRRRIGRFFPELAEALSGRSLEALPARIAERKTGGRAKINILRYKNQDEHENGEHDFACRRHGSAQNWSARVKLTLDIATVVDSRWTARLHVGDYSRRAANICNAIFSMRSAHSVISSKAVRGARNALGGNGIFVDFGVSAQRSSINGSVARQIFPFKAGNLIEKNVID